MRTYVRVTSQGHPHTQLQRAIQAGNALVAWATAYELRYVSLADALSLILLVRDDEDRYERAALKWHARLCLETPRMSLTEAATSLQALQNIERNDRMGVGVETLEELLGFYRHKDVLRALRSGLPSKAHPLDPPATPRKRHNARRISTNL